VGTIVLKRVEKVAKITMALSGLVEWVSDRPILLILGAFLLFKIMTKRMQGPFPECGGRVKAIHSETEWLRAMSDNELVVVDFFASWCPP